MCAGTFSRFSSDNIGVQNTIRFHVLSAKVWIVPRFGLSWIRCAQQKRKIMARTLSQINLTPNRIAAHAMHTQRRAMYLLELANSSGNKRISDLAVLACTIASKWLAHYESCQDETESTGLTRMK